MQMSKNAVSELYDFLTDLEWALLMGYNRTKSTGVIAFQMASVWQRGWVGRNILGHVSLFKALLIQEGVVMESA